jgi:hypothetical protein
MTLTLARLKGILFFPIVASWLQQNSDRPHPRIRKQNNRKQHNSDLPLRVVYLQSMIGGVVPLKMPNLNGPAERHFHTPSSLCQKTVEYDTA